MHESMNSHVLRLALDAIYISNHDIRPLSLHLYGSTFSLLLAAPLILLLLLEASAYIKEVKKGGKDSESKFKQKVRVMGIGNHTKKNLRNLGHVCVCVGC